MDPGSSKVKFGSGSGINILDPQNLSARTNLPPWKSKVLSHKYSIMYICIAPSKYIESRVEKLITIELYSWVTRSNLLCSHVRVFESQP